MRFLLLLLLIGAAPAPVLAADEDDELALERPPKSVKARRYREKALDLWTKIEPVWVKVRANEKIDPLEAAKTAAYIEEGVDLYERSLAIEWHSEANRTLATMVKTYFKVKELVPQAPPPGQIDPDKLKAMVKKAAKDKRQRMKDARRFVMKYGAARRYTSLLRRCPKCEGRKELRSPFGGKPRPCNICKQQGALGDREGIIEAFWLSRSPLHREQTRNTRDVNRALKMAATRPETLAPFVRSVEIRDLEDHESWVRIKTREKIHQDPHTKNSEKREQVYTLYHVGRRWWLYSPRHDRDLMEIPEIPDEKDG